MPIDASIADFAFSSCYKWMLGTTGTAVAYWNRARQPHWAPNSAGWYSIIDSGRLNYAHGLQLRPDAMRFTRGNPAHLSIYVLNQALDFLLQYDMRDVQAHVQTLTTALLARLAANDIASTTPPDPARHGASVCIAHPQANALVDALYQRGVWAWGGRGRVRFSFHGYNSLADVAHIEAALLDCLSALRNQEPS